jgi:uncharacterized protein YecT (DUF1311 family)
MILTKNQDMLLKMWIKNSGCQKMKKYQIIFSLVSLLFVSVSTSQAASFDCAKATTAREREICTDAELSKLDERL